jgi:integrase
VTGWRISEVLGLEWSRVDMPAREVRLHAETTKNDDARVPVHQGAGRLVDGAGAELRDTLGLTARQYVCHTGDGGRISNFWEAMGDGMYERRLARPVAP